MVLAGTKKPPHVGQTHREVGSLRGDVSYFGLKNYLLLERKTTAQRSLLESEKLPNARLIHLMRDLYRLLGAKRMTFSGEAATKKLDTDSTHISQGVAAPFRGVCSGPIGVVEASAGSLPKWPMVVEGKVGYSRSAYGIAAT